MPPEVDEENIMKHAEIREIVKSKFHIGQKVTLKLNDAERYGGDKIVVKIIGFYPDNVLVERKGFKESFRYFEFLNGTIGIKEEILINEAEGWHKY